MFICDSFFPFVILQSVKLPAKYSNKWLINAPYDPPESIEVLSSASTIRALFLYSICLGKQIR